MRLIEPLKWRKYLLLTEFGFLSKRDLQKQIARYPRHAIRRLTAEIGDALGRVPRGAALFVIKLVTQDEPGGFPNLRVTSHDDLAAIPAFLSARSSYPYIEIWTCYTCIDPSVLSVAGRLIISSSEVWEQSVEQLWRASPRMLESYHGGSSFPHAYLRATRVGWGWPYNIQQVHVPQLNGRLAALSYEQLRVEFAEAMVSIERSREQLAFFAASIGDRGANIVSIEYKLTGSRLDIIDWDTPDDRRVLS
ncbi:MAG: hypothetical protein ACLQU1_24065 [Bryobacteraceae bacterium]